ncbi:MAG: hypothetical protein QXQ52_05145 [Candidatus Methanomethylicaceae archaeon]
MNKKLENISNKIPLREILIKFYSIPIYISGMMITPQKFITKLFFITFISIFITTILLIFKIYFGILFIIPPILYAIIPYLEIIKRKNNCERELPFVSTFLTMAATSSIPLSLTILNLSKLYSLKAFAKEAMRIEKIRKLYALSPSDAIIFEAKNHPSEYTKSVLLTAISAQKSGESLYLIMKDEMIKSFSILLSRLKILSDKFSLLASLQIIIFIIIPMAMITLGVMFSGIIKPLFLTFICIGLPCIFTPIMSYFIDLYFPKELTEPLNLLPFIISLSFIPIAIFIILKEVLFYSFPYILAFLIIIFTMPIAIFYHSQRRKTKQILEALPTFSRSIAEKVKKGLSPTQALLSINRDFNSIFNKILYKISIYIKGGLRIKEASLIIKMPWIAHVYFELLDFAEQIGADPRAMEALSDLVNNIHSSIKSLSSQTSLFKFSCIINSIILPFVISMVIEIVVKIFTNISSIIPYIPMEFSFITPELLPIVKTIAYSGVILDAYLLGLIGGKISEGSIVDGLLMALICVIIALITLFIFVELKIINSIFY